jgi:hypothetical protein
VKLVPLPFAAVFHPVNLYPVRVKVFVVSAVETFKVSVSGVIVPVPPFALKVTVAVVALAGGGVDAGAFGTTGFDGVEYMLLPNLLIAATVKE